MASTDPVDRLNYYKPNWTKCLLAIHETEDAIRPVVRKEVQELHKDIVRDIIGLQNNVSCQKCEHTDIKNYCTGKGVCPTQNMCGLLSVKIEKYHSRGRPSWEYVNFGTWTKDSWQFAKAFMTSQNCAKKMSNADDTDLTGMLSIILNCKWFKSRHIFQGDNVFSEGKSIRNYVMHWTSVGDISDDQCRLKVDGLCDLLRHIAAPEPQDRENIERALQRLEQIKGQDLIMKLTEPEAIKKEAKRGLQHYLVRLYEKFCPPSPLSEQVPTRRQKDIRDLYVPPTMKTVNLDSGEYGDKISGFRQVFYKSAERLKRIYIVGDAGCGKTTFGKRMALAWCKTNSPDTEGAENDSTVHPITNEDEDTIREFDYLFLVSLRFERSRISVVDMIKNQLFGTEEMFHGIVDSLLQEDGHKCLILLDGLDEWTPPTNEQMSRALSPHGIPSIHPLSKCTVVTLTRPWKFEKMNLDASFIDQQIQLSGFDDDAAYQFIENTVAQLNKIFKTKQTKEAKSFHLQLSRKHLSQFKTVPIILKELICFWHDGKDIGSSKCQVFSGVMDTFLNISDIRYKATNSSSRSVLQNTTTSEDLPVCLQKMKKCNTFKPLLLSLSKMAFETLFNKDRENALVFEHDSGLEHLSLEEELLCFEIGILSANEVVKEASTQHRCISFFHKTIQEFLAAVHIAMFERIDTFKERLSALCDGDGYEMVDVVQEMFNVFVFLSGMNVTKAGQVFNIVSRALSCTQRTETYRSSCHNQEDKTLGNYTALEVRLLNTLAMQCMNESVLTGIPLALDLADIYLEPKEWSNEDCSIYQHLVGENTPWLKSVYISRYEGLATPVLGELAHIKGLERIHLQCQTPSSQFALLANDLGRNSMTTLISLGLINFSCALEKSIITKQSDQNVPVKGQEEFEDSTTLVYQGRFSLLKKLSWMSNLTAIALCNLSINERNARILFKQLETMKHLSEINISRVRNSNDGTDSGNDETGEDFEQVQEDGNNKDISKGMLVDFSEHVNLQFLNLRQLPIRCLQIYAKSIKILGLLCLNKTGDQEAVVKCHSRFEDLHILKTDMALRVQMDNRRTILEELKDCSNLTQLTLYDINLSRGLRLSEKLTELKAVYFNEVSMTKSAFLEFIDSIASHHNRPVEVECLWQTVGSDTIELESTDDSDTVIDDLCDYIKDTYECKWVRKHGTTFSCEFVIKQARGNM